MCLFGGGDSGGTDTPAPPAETLNQAAPTKKASSTDGSVFGSPSAADANPYGKLAVGSKKYRNTSTVQTSTKSSLSPGGLTIN